jgi:hypothetical protein
MAIGEIRLVCSQVVCIQADSGGADSVCIQPAYPVQPPEPAPAAGADFGLTYGKVYLISRV